MTNKNKEILDVLEENREVISVRLFGIEGENLQFVNIAHEKDEEFNTKFDLNIYFYVNNDINFNTLKVGDKLELDESYEILEIQR